MWIQAALLTALTCSGLAQPLEEDVLRQSNTPCGQHIMNPGETLTIQSAKHPKKYPKVENCAWEIGCSSARATLDLTCDQFDLQKSKKCKDYLTMFDDSTEYVKACGKDAPKEVKTNGNLVNIEFLSNGDKKRGKGFDCKVTCEVPVTTPKAPTTPSTTVETTTTGLPLDSTSDADDSTASFEPSCACGQSSAIARILGGGDAEVDEYPWQVAITPKRMGIPFCSASLLNTQYVITAAHCVDSIPVEHYDLVFGEHDFLKIRRTFKRQAAAVIVHPDFDKSTLDNDIALVKLNDPVRIFDRDQVIPVCLPTSDMNFEERSGVATGWGLTADGGAAATALQELDLDILSKDDCEAAYPNNDSDNMLCAGDDDSDVCQGDDGGPLVVSVDGHYVLAGITSQGDCGRNNKPGRFTNVQSHLEWIESELSTGVFCPIAPKVVTFEPEITTKAPTDAPTTKAATTKAATTKAATTAAPVTKAPTFAPTSLPGLQCACGVVDDKSGDAHSLTSNPWTLNLYSGNKIFCTATYINTMNVLTSANCVQGRGTSFSVRGNEETFGSGLPRAITRNPTNIIINNDLAIIQLDVAFTMTKYSTMKPACLPTPNTNFLTKRATHSGYDSGRVKAKGGYWSTTHTSPRLRFNPDGGSSGAYCGEDLGGPIVSEINGRITLGGIGVGTGCAVGQEAAKVSDYYQWIFDNTQNGRFCVL